MSAVATILLQLLQIAPSVPGLITNIESLYSTLKPLLSSTDQAELDAALKSAKTADAQATAAADAALKS